MAAQRLLPHRPHAGGWPALADHARTTQVLLFTHHAQVVELARRAVPAERLHVIEWEPPA